MADAQPMPAAWAATAARKKALLHWAWNEGSRNGGMNIPLKPDLDVMLNSVVKAAVGENVDVEDWPVSRLRTAIRAGR